MRLAEVGHGIGIAESKSAGGVATALHPGKVAKEHPAAAVAAAARRQDSHVSKSLFKNTVVAHVKIQMFL